MKYRIWMLRSSRSMTVGVALNGLLQSKDTEMYRENTPPRHCEGT